MQNVSNAWKKAQEEMIVPEQYVQIEYFVTDPDVQDDSNASSDGEVNYSVTESITNIASKIAPKYATLEHNIWGLDGSFEVIPDAAPYGDTGYVGSELSLADGTYTNNPVISLEFSKVHTPIVPGMSVMWSNEYDECASDFRITSWNGNTASASYLIEGNRDNRSLLDINLKSFNRITIEIIKWNKPHHRPRITYAMIGLKQTYTKDNLMSYRHEMSVDLLSGALPKSAITFSLDNSNDNWNPDNPSGAEKYLLERQPLIVSYGMMIGGSIEWINAGTFYMSEWTTPMNGLEATFVARDVVDRMNDVYSGIRVGTLRDIALAAMEQAGIVISSDASVQYYVDASLTSINTDFSSSDNEFTVGEVLQMVANASCCVMYQDRSGVLRIEKESEDMTDYSISQNVSYSHPEYTISKELKAVSVNNGMGYAENSSVGEIQTIDNPLIIDTDTAQRVAEWIRDTLATRKTISGEFRADVRLDALDKINISSKYADRTVRITDITYELTGGLRGIYTGRVV